MTSALALSGLYRRQAPELGEAIAMVLNETSKDRAAE
jgi:hypothetical protein